MMVFGAVGRTVMVQQCPIRALMIALHGWVPGGCLCEYMGACRMSVLLRCSWDMCVGGLHNLCCTSSCWAVLRGLRHWASRQHMTGLALWSMGVCGVMPGFSSRA